jgi:hypothetical protein
MLEKDIGIHSSGHYEAAEVVLGSSYVIAAFFRSPSYFTYERNVEDFAGKFCNARDEEYSKAQDRTATWAPEQLRTCPLSWKGA